MNKLLILISMIVCLPQVIFAQTDSAFQKQFYRIWIKSMDKVTMNEGVLFEVKDSSLVISETYERRASQQGKFDISKINASSIYIIQTRKNHKLLKGVLIAGVPALFFGVMATASIISNSSPDDPLEGHAMTAGTVIGGVMVGLVITGFGVSIGAAIGAPKTKYKVRGNQHLFELYRPALNERAIKKNKTITYK